MISDLLSKLDRNSDLGYDDVSLVMADMLSGNISDSLNAEFLSKLADKGETDDELLGMLDEMQEFAIKIRPVDPDTTIDMCGTGGDRLQTFNVSTTASFVVAASGGTVAKHGNRSSTGVSGSADIFEYFGYDLNQEPSDVLRVLKRHGITFMFAQRFHPAMRHVAAARRQLSQRTAFNLLGPLSNPAGVKNQLVGVSSTGVLERIPKLLRMRGAQNVMTVCSDDGMDEFSTSAANKVYLLQDSRAMTYSVDPEAVGLHMSTLRDIQVKSKQDAVTSFVGVLNGTANRAMIETTALNAAGGLIVGGVAKDFKDGVEMALDTIDEGKAFALLERFVADTGDVARLRELI